MFKGKKMAGHMGDERVTTQNLKIVKTDADRGLIMVEGAVPGAKGGWILVRDAVKRALPEGVPMPGAFRKPRERRRSGRGSGSCRSCRLSNAERRRPSDGPQGHHARRQGRRHRSRCRTRFSASSRAPTSCSAWSATSSPSGRPARTRPRRAARSATTKKMFKQKGTGRARHGAKTAPQFRGGGKAFGPVVRSHAHDLPKKVRALALKHALSDKARGEKLIVIADAKVKEPKTKALAGAVRQARPRQRADHRRRRGRRRISRWPPATSPISTCCRCRASTSTTSCAATRWC